MPTLYRNAATAGTFSSGAQTNSLGSYYIRINAGIQVSVSDGRAGVQPYYFTVDQIENGFAFANVIAGMEAKRWEMTAFTDFAS